VPRDASVILRPPRRRGGERVPLLLSFLSPLEKKRGRKSDLKSMFTTLPCGNRRKKKDDILDLLELGRGGGRGKSTGIVSRAVSTATPTPVRREEETASSYALSISLNKKKEK